MSESSLPVAVVGGGIAGLATAFNIEREAAGRDLPAAVTVFEAQPEVGGNLRTIAADGFQVEAGPNGFLDNEPATLRLVDRVGLQEELQRSEDTTRLRFLLVNGRICEMPMTPPAFIKTPMLSLPAKLRVACELFIRPRSDLGLAAEDPATDETVYDFGVRRLGRDFAEVFLDPMVKGVFGGDARKLSLASAFPRMVELEQEYGGLFKALYRISRKNRKTGDGAASPGPSGVLHSFHTGMETLPHRVAAALKGRVLTDSPVESIHAVESGWEIVVGDEIHGPFAAVVETAPAHAAANHFEDLELKSLLAEIPYAPMAVITMAHRRNDVDHPLEGFGMLIPTRERMKLLGVLWSASIFTGRAPDGNVILRAMAGGASDRDILDNDDETLIGMARRELGPLFGVKADPVRTWVIRWEHAIAQFEPGHLARLAAVERRLEGMPGLILAGSSYRGISVNHCVAEAEKTAVSVLDHLAGTVAADTGKDS